MVGAGPSRGDRRRHHRGVSRTVGPGVRVDSAGYAGWSPPPQFDPLLAKVIATSGPGSHSDAIDSARRAVQRFHIGGLTTNLGQLEAILAHPNVDRVTPEPRCWPTSRP